MSEPAGRLLARLREDAGLTQLELAHVLKVTEGTISQYENGRISPRRPKAWQLDDLVGAGGELAQAWGYAPITPPSGRAGSGPTAEAREADTSDKLDDLSHAADAAMEALTAIQKNQVEMLRLLRQLAQEPEPSPPEAAAPKPPAGSKPRRAPGRHVPVAGE